MYMEQLYTVQSPSSIPYHCYINTPKLIALSQTQPTALCVQPSITNRRGNVRTSNSLADRLIKGNKIDTGSSLHALLTHKYVK